MNARRWLIISVGANVLLALVVLRGLNRPAGGATARAVPTVVTNRVLRVKPVAVDAAPTVVEVTPPFDWRQVESADYRVYMENLRGIGCPEPTLRGIIVADVRALFAARVRDLVATVQSGFWDYMAHEKALKELIDTKEKELEALSNEQDAVFEALFGNSDPDYAENEVQRRDDFLERVAADFDFVSADKRAQLVAVWDRTSDARAELRNATNGLTAVERQQKMKALADDEQQQIQALLTPAELGEYQLRKLSEGNLRSDLADFAATQDELRTIASAKANAPASLPSLLGEERWVEYQRATNADYQLTCRVTGRFELPREVAIEVHTMRQTAEAQAATVRADATLSVEQRQALLQAMQVETEKSISATLGAKAFKAYRKNGGDWLNSFTQIKP